MQPIAQAAFILTAVIGSAYFLIRQRRFDFFTIGFASGLVYFLPGFLGFVRSSRDYSLAEPILPETYLVFIAILASILAGAIIFDQFSDRRRSADTGGIALDLTTETALIIAMAGLVLTIATSGSDLFSARKSDVMEVIGRWHILFRFGAMFMLLFAIVRKQTSYAMAAVALLLFDLYIGFRVGIVIAALSAATLILHERGSQSLIRSERRNLFLGVILVAAVFLYKRVYTVVKLGLWDVVVERLTDPEILFLALMTSEPFGSQTILNEVIRTGFDVSPAHLGSAAALLVPFSNMLGAEVQSFNSLFQEQLFGGVVRGGMASNIWAQFYAIGGWAGLALIIPIYVALLALGSWLLSSARNSVLVLVAIVFAFIAFYIHRNDVLFLLVLLRRSLMIWAMAILPGMLLVDIVRTRYRRLPAVSGS